MASLEHSKMLMIRRLFGVISLVGFALSAGQTLAEDLSRGKAPSSAAQTPAETPSDCAREKPQREFCLRAVGGRREELRRLST